MERPAIFEKAAVAAVRPWSTLRTSMYFETRFTQFEIYLLTTLTTLWICMLIVLRLLARLHFLILVFNSLISVYALLSQSCGFTFLDSLSWIGRVHSTHYSWKHLKTKLLFAEVQSQSCAIRRASNPSPGWANVRDCHSQYPALEPILTTVFRTREWPGSACIICRCAHSPFSKQTAEMQLYQLYHHIISIISIFLLIKRTSLNMS